MLQGRLVRSVFVRFCRNKVGGQACSHLTVETKRPGCRADLLRTWLALGAMQLSLFDHMHGFDAGNHFLGTAERLETPYGVGDLFHYWVVML